jgi:hypothetical protein
MCVLELGNRGPQAYFFASIISSERASFHDENCAGDAVTWQRDKSRTLICEATWVCARREEGAGVSASSEPPGSRMGRGGARTFTSGRIESYSDCEIFL